MKSKARRAWKSFGGPGWSIRYIGITGTDGKSTTSGASYHILKSAGVRVGIISTVHIDVWAWLQDNISHMTSLDHKMFWSYIDQADHNGLTHMVIEVSSHALYQYRIWPLMFESVGVTNLTREHLDFHWTMEHYAQTKGELFGRLVNGGLGILPQDFEYKKYFRKPSEMIRQSLKTFGQNERADIFVSDIVQHPSLEFDLHIWWEQTHISSQLVWVFNTDNLMIAAQMTHHEWLSLDQIKQWIQSYKGLPGRQELVHTQEDITAMIDFAVTPDALSTVYSAAREMWYGRLIAIFGATGNRDQGKRPKMGAIVTQLCDIVIITEDENYHEDGMEIMKQVEEWVDGKASRREGEETVQDKQLPVYMLVQDRTEAIYRGLKLAQPGDVVIVTGMANYTTRSMNEWSISRNEKEVIETQMKRLGFTVENHPTLFEEED